MDLKQIFKVDVFLTCGIFLEWEPSFSKNLPIENES